MAPSQHKKWCFKDFFSKYAASCRFGHIYWKNLEWETFFCSSFYGQGSAVSKLQSHYEKKFSVLIWATLRLWKPPSAMDPPQGFSILQLKESQLKIPRQYFFKIEKKLIWIWSAKLKLFKSLCRFAVAWDTL